MKLTCGLKNGTKLEYQFLKVERMTFDWQDQHDLEISNI